MPEKEINQLISKAVTQKSWAEKLLDPETRESALKEVTQPGSILSVSLTDEEIEALLNIEATDLAGFAAACENYQELLKKGSDR